MIKVLIANNNLNEIKGIITTLSYKNNNIKIINISTEKKEALRSTLNLYPDIIISEKDFFSKKEIQENYFYNPLFVTKEILNNEKKFKEVINTILIQKNLKRTNKKNININLISKKIFKHLLKLNFNSNMKGTIYLADSIAYTYFYNERNVIECLNTSVYPIVANKNNTTTDIVRWDIIKTINQMYKYNKRYEPKIINNFLNSYTEMQSSAKLFIKQYLNMLLKKQRISKLQLNEIKLCTGTYGKK